jgi:hypothetical protein
MGADTSLIFNILAKDKASRIIGKVGGNIGKVSAGIVAAGVAAAVGLAKVGDDFDAAFDSIRIGTGATGDQLAGLEASFKNVATQVPNAIGDTATVLADFNTLTGATGKDLESLTETYLNLERITGESVGPETITRVFGDWGVATKDQAATMDDLFRVSQTTGIGVGDLATKVVQFGAPLRNMGFTLDQSVALFGKWQKEGVNTETVMSGLRTASGKWAREGKDLPTTLESTIEAIQGAGSAAEAQEIALANFGARAGPDMAAAILEGRFEIDELMATLAGNEDTINGLATETEDWQEKLAKLKNEGLVALEPIASTVFGLLNDGVPVLRSVGQWMQNNAGTVKALAIALGSIAATILLVNVGLKIYHGIMMVVRAATLVWAAVQWVLNLAFLANPITWIILGIIALIAVIVLIATKTTWFQTIWKVVWGGIKAAALAVWSWISGTLWPGIKRVWEGIVGGAKMVWRGIQLYFGFWQGMLNRVIGWVVGVRNRIVGAFTAVVDFVRGLPGRIRSAAGGMWDGIRDSFRAALNWIISKWNGLSFTLPAISVFGKTIGGMTLSTPDIPHLARGGIITGPTLALLGEGGRDEAVIPLPRGMRPGGGAQPAQLPDEFMVEATIDLGEGISRVVEMKLRRKNQGVVRRVGAGVGRSR